MIAVILFLALQQPQEPHITPESASHYPMLHVACNNGDQAPLLDAEKKQMGWIYCDGRNAVFVPCDSRCAKEEKFTSDNLVVGEPYSPGSLKFIERTSPMPSNLSDWIEWQHMEWLNSLPRPVGSMVRDLTGPQWEWFCTLDAGKRDTMCSTDFSYLWKKDYLEKTAPPQIKAICGEQMECMHPRPSYGNSEWDNGDGTVTNSDGSVYRKGPKNESFSSHAVTTVPRKKPVKKSKPVDPFCYCWGGMSVKCGEKQIQCAKIDHPVYEQRLVPGECAAHGGWQNGCDPVYTPMIVPPPPLPKGLQ